MTEKWREVRDLNSFLEWASWKIFQALGLVAVFMFFVVIPLGIIGKLITILSN